MIKVYVHIGDEKRLVGKLHDNIFCKIVYKSRHLYRELNAWGLDAQVFKEFILPKAIKIIILDKTKHVYYEVSVEDWKNNGKHLQFNPHRAQIFLPLKYFTKNGTNKDFRY